MLPPELDDAPPLSDEQVDGLFDWYDQGFSDTPPTVDVGHVDPEISAAWKLSDVARRWQIDSTGAAEWAMRKLAAAAEEHDYNLTLAAEWKRQVDEWLSKANRGVDRRVAFFDGRLCDYQRRRREADPRAKSLKLPSGEVTSRTVPAGPVIINDTGFLAWAKKWLAAAVRVKEEPAMAELKKAVEFRTVVVPAFGGFAADEVFEVEGYLVAIPTSIPDETEAWLEGFSPKAMLEAETWQEEAWPIHVNADGRFLVVPGVAEKPETISISTKPGKSL